MMGDGNVSEDLQEVEDRFEEELGPTMCLKSAIDLNDLQNGEVEFEISDELADGQLPEFDKRDVYKYMDQDALGVDVDEAGGDGEPFEVLARKMVNITSDGGVKKMLLKQGTGGPIPEVATVRIHYNAYLEYADEPFDSTYLRDRAVDILLDDVKDSYTAIYGLILAVRTMRKGEYARFLIRSDYAYGDLGAPPRIPTKATILYQVEMVNIFEYGSVEHRMTAKERKEAPFKQILKMAEAEKIKGGDLFKQQKYNPAFHKYRRAINLLEDARLADDEDEKQQQKYLLTLYLNAALCALKLSQPRRVFLYCNLAKYIDNNNPKGHYYRGKAHRQLGEFDKAKESLIKARQLKPSSKDIAKELNELEKKMQQMQLRDQQLYRRMFGFKENQCPPELKATKGDKAVQTIDEAFRKQMGALLDDFLADSDAMEMPFSGNSFTAAELGCIAAIAREKDLDVSERGEKAGFHIKVLKKSPTRDIQT